MNEKKNKMKKAAIAAVLSYINLSSKKHKENKWVKLGRIIIMKNNIMVQTKKF